MKNYTLTADAFYGLDEIVGTIDYMKEQFPGLLENSLPEYLKTDSSLVQIDSNRIKLALCLIFNSKFDGNKSFQSLYGHERNDILLQQKLANDFKLDDGDLHDINITKAMEYGLLVEVTHFQLSYAQQFIIVKALKDMLNGNLTSTQITEIKNVIAIFDEN